MSRSAKWLSLRDMLQLWADREAEATMATGIGPLDAALGGGLPYGFITTLIGYASTGKSELARQIAFHAAHCGVGVAIVDVELGPERYITRALSQKASVAGSTVRKKRFDKEEYGRIEKAREALASEARLLYLRLDDIHSVAELAIAIEVACAALERPRSLVVMDSIQRLAKITFPESRLHVQDFMLWAEQFAHKTQAALLLTSEQKRSVEGKAPKPEDALSAGAESRSIEYYSDVMIALVPQKESTDMQALGATQDAVRRVKLLLPKVREGAIGYIPGALRFVAPYWDMNVEAPGDMNPLKLQQALAKMEKGIGYSASDLRSLWSVGTDLAKKIRERLEQEGKIVYRNNCFERSA